VREHLTFFETVTLFFPIGGVSSARSEYYQGFYFGFYFFLTVYHMIKEKKKRNSTELTCWFSLQQSAEIFAGVPIIPGVS